MSFDIRSLALIFGLLASAVAAFFAFQPEPQPVERIVRIVEPSDTGTRLAYSDGNYPVLTLPDGSKQPIRSVLDISERLRFGQAVWDDRDVPDGPMLVRVDLSRQLVSVFRGGHEIGSTIILYGAASKPTPTGMFKVLQKSADYHSRTYDAPMPYMLRLTSDGVAIHGSDVRERAATHGCIGVPLDFARHLYAAMSLGDRVAIVKAD
ncbi:MAG: L,D-transpeptidase family protein [Novosphingobium sp.]|nr:L,D-transpeptidase family protein [Novosphingobium sp.]